MSNVIQAINACSLLSDAADDRLGKTVQCLGAEGGGRGDGGGRGVLTCYVRVAQVDLTHQTGSSSCTGARMCLLIHLLLGLILTLWGCL